MKLKLVEPLRELFKDEVRALGLELGLGMEIINRHPFPGPGLAIRIIGEVTEKEVRDTARGGRHSLGGDKEGKPLYQALAGIRGAFAHKDGRGNGRREDLRETVSQFGLSRARTA